jgi:hypothetical protein
MPEIYYFFLQELTLLRIELQTGFPESPKQFLEVKQVLLERAANHDYVVQVHEI